MPYLNDIYFENINVVHRMGDFYHCEKGEEWYGIDDIFEQNKFYFIVEGSCTIIIDGIHYIGNPGDWFFIPANKKHTFYNKKSAVFSKYFIHFDVYPLINFFNDNSLSYKIHVSKDSCVYELFERYIEILDSNRIADKMEIKSILFRMLSLYITISSSSDISVSLKVPSSLLDTLTYIEKHLTEELSNETLAQISHLHPNHFVRTFKEKIGQTPQRYITQKRMDAAKRLTEETTLSFTEIAALSGIHGSTHFTKLFKTYFGQTPRQYRKFANSAMRAHKPKL